MALTFIFSLKTYAICPDTTQKETFEDCPWSEMARDILQEPKKCIAILKKQTPFLLPKLKLDKNAAIAFRHWGLAKNFDDNAKAVIVEDPILRCIAQILNLEKTIQQEPQYQTVHAGLQHTYAYLFSNTPTPYGYKRARWTNGDLKNGFGFEKMNPLFPDSKKGAFLTNVTYFFAKFAFKDDAALLSELEIEGKKNKALAESLLLYKKEKYEIQKLVEHVKNTDYKIHTVFVKMNTEKIKSSNTHLLIYWIENTKAATKQLITGFPVEASFVTKALDAKGLGEDKPITLRYNAFVPELTSSVSPLTGLREIR
jgi:hypothetical protein